MEGELAYWTQCIRKHAMLRGCERIRGKRMPVNGADKLRRQHNRREQRRQRSRVLVSSAGASLAHPINALSWGPKRVSIKVHLISGCVKVCLPATAAGGYVACIRAPACEHLEPGLALG